MARREYQFRIRSSVSYLEKVRRWAADIASTLGFDERGAFEVEISVYEACANVIEHAYANDPENSIEIKIAADPRKITIIILDHGGAFERSSLKKRDIAKIIETEQDGGLGIHIIEACMDEILYRRKNGVNILQLVKYLPTAERGGS